MSATEKEKAGSKQVFGECHAHIAMDGIEYAAAMARHRQGVDEAVVRQHLEAYRTRGVTFVRDGGDAFDVSCFARDIAPEYGIDYRSPLFAIHKNGHYGSIVGRGFDTMREYAALVGEAARGGADFIKIMTTGIMDFDRYGVIMAGAPLETREVAEMVHIAHEEGFAVMAHTNGAGPVMEALEAGVDSIEHGNYLDDTCLRALAESKTAFVPTATVAYNLIGKGRFDDEVLGRIAATSQQAIARAFDLGVILALGSDAGAVGVLHGQGVLDEYERFKASVSCTHELLDTRLAAGEAYIRATFQRR